MKSIDPEGGILTLIGRAALLLHGVINQVDVLRRHITRVRADEIDTGATATSTVMLACCALIKICKSDEQ